MKSIRSKSAYEAALREMEKLWGSKLGTRKGNKLNELAAIVEKYEQKHYPFPAKKSPGRGKPRRGS